MRPTPTPAACHWDGSPRTVHPRRPLRVAATSPSRLLRCSQSVRCRWCGNRIDVYQRGDQRPIALHPTELATTQVPASCHWHVSRGIAHPHGDGSAWCRIPHMLLCPHLTPAGHLSPHIAAVRRQLAVRTRRLIDTGASPRPPQPPLPHPSPPVSPPPAADARTALLHNSCWAATSPTGR
ncbi:DUF6083 domain-containing protein [Streptomyces mirabilis]|uniref:DUF6083 domain-containing protein n=1 Tax=Streptomyces mirabilis TaxID=68239 RepID=UPI0036D90180